jgi:hypothetical protein
MDLRMVANIVVSLQSFRIDQQKYYRTRALKRYRPERIFLLP